MWYRGATATVAVRNARSGGTHTGSSWWDGSLPSDVGRNSAHAGNPLTNSTKSWPVQGKVGRMLVATEFCARRAHTACAPSLSSVGPGLGHARLRPPVSVHASCSPPPSPRAPASRPAVWGGCRPAENDTGRRCFLAGAAPRPGREELLSTPRQPEREPALAPWCSSPVRSRDSRKV